MLRMMWYYHWYCWALDTGKLSNHEITRDPWHVVSYKQNRILEYNNRAAHYSTSGWNQDWFVQGYGLWIYF